MNGTQIIVDDFDPAGPYAGLILPPRFRKRQSETRFKQNWKLTPLQYWQMMREGYELHSKRWLPTRRKQRGSIILAGFGVPSAGASGSVNIGPHTVSDSRFTAGTSDARISWERDGELWGIRLIGSDVQYNTEWWTDEPDGTIGDSYECRHISTGKSGTYSVEAAVANTWVTISTTRQWGVTRSANGSKSCTATFECGLDGVESALDTALITTIAIVDFL